MATLRRPANGLNMLGRQTTDMPTHEIGLEIESLTDAQEGDEMLALLSALLPVPMTRLLLEEPGVGLLGQFLLLQACT